MADGNADRDAAIRKIIAAVALCLLLMRAVGVIGVPAAGSGGSGLESPPSAQAVMGVLCGAGHDDQAGKRSGKHAGHCIFCMSAARDLLGVLVLVVSAELDMAVKEMARFRAHLAARPFLPRPAGLIANWSAHSPPPRA